MSNCLETISAKYLTAKKLSGGTRKEYKSTVTKWTTWGNGVDVDQIGRSHIREFLDWVHDQAAVNGGSNPGRTANKARNRAGIARRTGRARTLPVGTSLGWIGLPLW